MTVQDVQQIDAPATPTTFPAPAMRAATDPGKVDKGWQAGPSIGMPNPDLKWYGYILDVW